MKDKNTMDSMLVKMLTDEIKRLTDEIKRLTDENTKYRKFINYVDTMDYLPFGIADELNKLKNKINY